MISYKIWKYKDMFYLGVYNNINLSTKDTNKGLYCIS
jgi:hypothetical protein